MKIHVKMCFSDDQIPVDESGITDCFIGLIYVSQHQQQTKNLNICLYFEKDILKKIVSNIFKGMFYHLNYRNRDVL